MRSSILSRSVIAVASLAIGSVALAATPATAATPSGITRETVLTAAAGLRITTPTADQSAATTAAVRDITIKGCGIPASDVNQFLVQAKPTQAGDDADGIVLAAYIYGSQNRSCTIGAFATADASFQLTGTVTAVSNQTPAPSSPSTTLLTAALSGDVFVTPSITSTSPFVTVSAVGNAAKSTTNTVVTKVADKKTKSQKKAAKKKYEKRIKAAKKSYKKALAKAGSSKSKKAAAKKVYKAKRADAKARYKKSIAGFKIVKTTVTTTENRPFSVLAQAPALG